MMNIKERIVQAKSEIPAVYIALKDKRTPLIAKILACITLGYVLSPIDLIPDFIPVLGYFDDIIIVPALVVLTVKCIPKDVWLNSKEKAISIWLNGKPKKWYYGTPIVIIWALTIWLILKSIW